MEMRWTASVSLLAGAFAGSPACPATHVVKIITLKRIAPATTTPSDERRSSDDGAATTDDAGRKPCDQRNPLPTASPQKSAVQKGAKIAGTSNAAASAT